MSSEPTEEIGKKELTDFCIFASFSSSTILVGIAVGHKNYLKMGRLVKLRGGKNDGKRRPVKFPIMLNGSKNGTENGRKGRKGRPVQFPVKLNGLERKGLRKGLKSPGLNGPGLADGGLGGSGCCGGSSLALTPSPCAFAGGGTTSRTNTAIMAKIDNR